MYVCMYVRICACIHVSVCIYVYIHVCMHDVWMYACMCVFVQCVCMHAGEYAHDPANHVRRHTGKCACLYESAYMGELAWDVQKTCMHLDVFSCSLLYLTTASFGGLPYTASCCGVGLMSCSMMLSYLVICDVVMYPVMLCVPGTTCWARSGNQNPLGFPLPSLSSCRWCSGSF